MSLPLASLHGPRRARTGPEAPSRSLESPWDRQDLGAASAVEPSAAAGCGQARSCKGVELTEAVDLQSSLEALVRAEVDFVLIGVSGINFYARTPSDAVATLDVDLLLGPRVENLRQAFQTLLQLGYRFEAGGEPFLDSDDESSLAQIVRTGARVSAMHETAGELDLMLSISGFAFDELRREAQRFRIADTEILVGKLEQLLRSKEIAGRPKDLEFLRAFAVRAGGEEDET